MQLKKYVPPGLAQISMCWEAQSQSGAFFPECLALFPVCPVITPWGQLNVLSLSLLTVQFFPWSLQLFQLLQVLCHTGRTSIVSQLGWAGEEVILSLTYACELGLLAIWVLAFNLRNLKWSSLLVWGDFLYLTENSIYSSFVRHCILVRILVCMFDSACLIHFCYMWQVILRCGFGAKSLLWLPCDQHRQFSRDSS